MTSMNILKALEYLDEDVILEAGMERPRGRRLLSRPALIAAILAALLLIITACAAIGGTEWFLRYFSEATPGELSTEQVEYIVANTLNVNKSQTVNGYTFTLKSAFSDGRDILLHFDLTAPKGTVLDADHYGDLHGTVLEYEAGMPLSISMSWKMTDEDRTDNRVSLVYSINAAWGDSEKFTDRDCRFYIYGIEARWFEQLEERTEPLAEGCWSFNIHFPEDCGRSISFVQEPVTVYQMVTVDYERIDENTMRPVTERLEGEITALNLWALGAELSFRFGEESRNAEFGDIYAVMKDGKEVLLEPYFVMPDFITYKTETPLILDQVDHLLLEDGTVFQAP